MLNITFSLFSSLFCAIVSIVLYNFLGMNILRSVEPMANNGLIFVSNTSKVQALCFKACKLVKKMLYIKVNDEAKNTLPILSRQIVNIYSKNAIQCGDVDVRLMLNYKSSMKAILTSSAIDIVMFDNSLTKFAKELKASVQTATKDAKDVVIDACLPSHLMESDEDEYVTRLAIRCLFTRDLKTPGLWIIVRKNRRRQTVTAIHYGKNPGGPESEDISSMVSEETVETYDYVALGGTFDRLHNGHKILLSQAALRCNKHMAVGVTDVNMIQSKKLWELIEPVEKRIKSVLDFLNDIKPGLEYDVFPLKDLYGPTKDDPKYQLIVVSEETAKGADKINVKRVENGLPELDRYVISLAEDSTRKSEEEENKVSSSNQRMRLLGTLMRPPQINTNIPDWPYVLGLAGGIASGKSSIANKLKAKGAAIINCDIIAHELYKPGLPLNSTIAHNFGDHVINNEGEVDRKLLGQIVFGDTDKLERLNQLVWPAVIEEAQKRIQELGKAGYKVVVMEAAVMIKAKWYNQCHQLWTVIIPREEAIKRIIERNDLSEEEARQRVDAQPSNLEQIALANVIFSPYWSYQYTQGQVDRAWDELQKYLANRK